MKKTDLIKFVRNEITFSGALKINMPDAEIERIIDNETEAVYDLDRESVEMKYTIIPKGIFTTRNFRQTRTIQFPDCVRFITRLEEIKGRSSMWGINDPDISFTRLMNSDLFLSPLGSDTVALRTIQWSAWDQMKNYTLVDLNHSWNPKTHRLLITGHDPMYNVYAELSEKIDPTILWDDRWVRQWICAKAKKQGAKLFGIIPMTLLGGATLNASIIDQDADNDITACKEYWDKNNNPDWFLCFP